jgi:glutamine amidotransferase
MFMHNGAIEDFRRRAMRPLRDTLSDEAYSGLLGVTDSETIVAGLLDLMKENPAGLAGVTRETGRHVTEVCERLGLRATLNLDVTDSTSMAFTRYSTQGTGNSLYFIEDAGAFPRAVVVASGRLGGDTGWRQVPDRHLLMVEEDAASLRPL